ncbi:BON domain-containing protein [Pseudidiomarina sp. 1APP75-32.1]|uniref:BON domain-containing protein n=1 Tax=Pseudidiomarina terrestris TaxID=2820060 RepID=A0AAW7QXF1_9GAMM|nr:MULTISPECIES: BON domain-containing protein [unclassified Pseudidiomarina]MDN7124137.1 BON domain-containing protein [Pseudidiomarina sp. 1APP75-32.1]MDN7127210.1 BON domain-containing protein [Pseudidiomarina sp. 1APR75-33.1]MDN7128394.1 BON domain-containing protein [Pseudidiomarina sp. 1APR75-15]MDN7138590.1 BON domain-containing protein [Pseudidiomarina sp. 1ASP75-14]MEA3586884.1 BON domain-containing protein [Pseudidiomarina sp. 1APP75-27a]
MKIRNVFASLASVFALAFGTAAVATTPIEPAAQATEVATQDGGDHVSDAAINAKVQSKLMALESAAQVTVETTGGVVTLTGEVPTHDAYIELERLARDTEGVVGVRNQLSVKEEAN